MKTLTIALLTSLLLTGCRPAATDEQAADTQPAEDSLTVMNEVSKPYVLLVLALGQHDEDYVDAYYGPPPWRQEAQAQGLSLPEIRQKAHSLLERLAAAPTGERNLPVEQLRHAYLSRQLEALVARTEMLEGKRFRFDEEAEALYDVEVPFLPTSHFERIHLDLEAALPGSGPLADRLARFRKDFVIPPDRLDAVFQAAIKACRERTLEHLELPAEESFRVEYVTDKPWSGYNWYQGGYQSLIQVNTSLPIQVDRAVDLACHEGYPGHHVYNALLEKHLVQGRGWQEFAVYPLFSPQSLIAEGSANFGIEVAFPGDERVAFEREVIFPLAGLDPARAENYYRVMELMRGLSYADNEAARRYLDGEVNAEEAAAWLTTYALTPPERAQQRVRFIDKYRSYVINYNLGQDLVREYVEARGGTPDQPERRWILFEQLLSSPRLPSGLR